MGTQTSLDELKLWLDQEQLLQFHLTENDPLLLEIVTHELADMRVDLINRDERREEYTVMYKILTELLTLRIEKFAKGIR